MTIMYAARTPKGYRHIYSHPAQVEMCGDDKANIVRVAVTPDPKGTYWGWLNTGYYGPEGTVSFVWPSRMQVALCFTYGPEAETKIGRGKIVRVRVEEMK